MRLRDRLESAKSSYECSFLRRKWIMQRKRTSLVSRREASKESEIALRRKNLPRHESRRRSVGCDVDAEDEKLSA